MESKSSRSRRAFAVTSTFLMPLAVSALLTGEVTGQDPGGRGRIAFHSGDGSGTHIHIMDADGNGRTRLTDGTASNVAPEISPDGSRIVFASGRDGEYHIYLMDIDGQNQGRLTNTPNAEGEPTWSPDGERIYFRQELDDGRFVLCSVSTDGSGFRQLTDGTIRYMRPHVSPDGTKILAVSVSGGFQLYIMDVDGTNQQRLPNAPAGAAFASWSPSGERIVFATANPPPNLSADIHLINPDGTGLVRLTHGEGISEYPCWSPDGERIAFQTSRDGNFEIYVMDVDGGNLQRLTENSVLDWRPSWRIVR